MSPSRIPWPFREKQKIADRSPESDSSSSGGVRGAQLFDGLLADLESKLFRSSAVVHAQFGLSPGETVADEAIIERALCAYKLDAGDASKPSAVWADIFDTKLRAVHEILVSNSSQKISAMLRRPGDFDLHYGFDGIVVDFVRAIKKGANEFGNAYAAVPHDHLVRFAEIIGALPFENIDGWFIDTSTSKYGSMTTDQVLDAIDRHLGLRLQYKMPFPDDYGAQSERGVISFPVPQALYHAWRARELVRGCQRPRVLEIGGGLGRAAYFAWQMGIKDYTIVDLPVTSLAQANYLMRVLGEESVVLHGEARDESTTQKIKLLKPSDFLESSERYDLVINANSMTEMSRETAERYWNHIKKVAPRFLSMNHESNPFTVREIADADSSSVRASQRYPYGMRKSYAEELFVFDSAVRASEP